MSDSFLQALAKFTKLKFQGVLRLWDQHLKSLLKSRRTHWHKGDKAFGEVAQSCRAGVSELFSIRRQVCGLPIGNVGGKIRSRFLRSHGTVCCLETFSQFWCRCAKRLGFNPISTFPQIICFAFPRQQIRSRFLTKGLFLSKYVFLSGVVVQNV